jgi:hypothetical protein
MDGIKTYLLFIAGVLPICILLYFTKNQQSRLEIFWPLIFSFILIVIVKLKIQRFSLGLGILVAFMSATSANIFNHYIVINQKSELSYLADKLSERQDTYLENEYVGIPNKIEVDQNLEALINLLPETKKEIDQYLKLKYFKGYFKKSNIDFSLFNESFKP